MYWFMLPRSFVAREGRQEYRFCYLASPHSCARILCAAKLCRISRDVDECRHRPSGRNRDGSIPMDDLRPIRRFAFGKNGPDPSRFSRRNPWKGSRWTCANASNSRFLNSLAEQIHWKRCCALRWSPVEQWCYTNQSFRLSIHRTEDRCQLSFLCLRVWQNKLDHRYHMIFG